MRHFLREYRALRNQENKNRESTRRTVPMETPASLVLVSCDELGGYDLSDQVEDGPTTLHPWPILLQVLTLRKFENSSKSLSNLLDTQIADKCKAGFGYNVVLPPYTRNFLPPKPDFSSLEEFENKPKNSEPTIKKTVVEPGEAKASTDKPKVVRKNFGPPISEDWISDSKDEDKSRPKIEKKTVKPSFAKIEFLKSKEQVKSPRETTVKQGNQNRLNSNNSRGNQKNYNNMMCQRLGSNFKMYNKACYVCRSFDHPQANFITIKDRNMVQKAVLLKSGIVNTARQNFSKIVVLVNTARQVSAAHPKSRVNATRQMIYLSKLAHSSVKRPIHKKTSFNNSNVNQKVNTVRSKTVNTGRPKVVVNVVLGNRVDAVKALACWVWKPNIKILDHVSKHNSASITLRNMITLMHKADPNYEEIDEGYVAFGGNPRGGKITSKGTIKTGELDFENVYFVKELKLNLFSVSQMCDKKNSVLFNDTECIVLSLNIKLTDESHVLLKVPRKDNMYSVDSKNIVPKRGLTCLFEKATSDESKLWHRRLGHLNFKNMNKLVKGNLVRAERKNKTLIEAARTMLADSKLPTTFWAEAVNTACYVQNRVLVTKPHNKTPYELLHDKTSPLGFMRPFRCPVTFLNTKDHLGKFEGKANEGFFVGYSINSKAFRVFSSRTRIVKENMHPVVARNQSNCNASTKVYDDAGKARVETVPGKDYILLPLWTADPPFSQSLKSSQDNKFQPSSDNGKKVDKDLRQEISTVGTNTSNELPFDTEMPDLEDISTFNFPNDHDDVDEMADMNNFDTTIQVSHTPTIRVHKDYPLNQVIGDVQSTIQTRNMSKKLEELWFVSTINQRTNHKDLQNYIFACFLSQEEPKKVIYTLKDPSRIEAMHEELLHFKLQEVWTLVDLPYGKRAIAGSKDRPPMLAPGNYVQWKSRIKRYIDTKPNHELIHYCLENPPYELGWKDKRVPDSDGNLTTTTERVFETYKNVTQDIKDQLNAEAEVVQIILIGIDNNIYSTVDACPNACEMWKAIERLKQGESINVQDLETNLYWEFGKFTSQDGESLESYYSRFYKMLNELIRNQCKVTNHQVNVQFLLQIQPEWQRFMTLVKQSQELKIVSYHKLYDILKQHQHEVNEIRAEK
nr:hypothetical protein [Tanacetum cinerariifolium]